MEKKLLLIVCILQMWVMAIKGDADENHILPCFSYLYGGGQDVSLSPSAQCCDGFQELLNEDASYVCGVISQADSYGLDVDRILGLPSACGFSNAINCSSEFISSIQFYVDGALT
ncbi:hypothetical protein ACLOJK_016181 [Asimina triloba]